MQFNKTINQNIGHIVVQEHLLIKLQNALPML